MDYVTMNFKLSLYYYTNHDKTVSPFKGMSVENKNNDKIKTKYQNAVEVYVDYIHNMKSINHFLLKCIIKYSYDSIEYVLLLGKQLPGICIKIK